MIEQRIGTYQILHVLGRGGMGIVYKAVDTALDKEVALKVMHPLLVRKDRFLKRFKAEARALGRLQHPHIVNVFTLQHIEPHLFLVMEYIGGGTLKDLIKGQGAVSWEKARFPMEQTLQAIACAHRAGIIHRDIKPRNILLTRCGDVKVTDFGLAKILNPESDSLVRTRTGLTGGTLRYMPPEQLNGLVHVDHRSDIYALGMTFYEILSGRPPFEGLQTEYAVLKAIEAHDFPALQDVNPDLPPGVGELIMKAVERDPVDRFESAEAMLEAIRDWDKQKCIAEPGHADHKSTALPVNHLDVVPEGVLEPEPAPGLVRRALLNLSTTMVGLVLLMVMLLYPGRRSVFNPVRPPEVAYSIQDPEVIPETDAPLLASVPVTAPEQQQDPVPSEFPLDEVPEPEVKEKPPGTLKILVRPFGDIYINGTLRARQTPAPYEIELEQGAHRIQVVHPMLGTWEKEIELTADTQDVLFNYNQQFSLDVTSDPPGAEVSIDGASTGLFTPARVRLHPGRHTIQVGTGRNRAVPRILSVESDRIDHPVHFNISR